MASQILAWVTPSPWPKFGSVLYLDQKKKQQNLKGYTHDISLNCATCQTKILWNLWLSNVTAKLICFVAPPSLCLCPHMFFYPILREPLNKICVQCHRQNPSLDNTYQLQIVQWSYVLKSILTQHFCPFCPAAAPIIPLKTSIDPTTDWSRRTKVVF